MLPFENLKSGMTTEQAFVSLKMSEPQRIGSENYQYLQQIWKQQQTTSFTDFLRCYNKTIVAPTLEEMQKLIAFYRDKVIDMV